MRALTRRSRVEGAPRGADPLLPHPVGAEVVGNRRLADACERWAFCSLTCSPGARRYYDALRARGKTHSQATRQLANRWVGVLHALLERRQAYQEEVAWLEREEAIRLVA